MKLIASMWVVVIVVIGMTSAGRASAVGGSSTICGKVYHDKACNGVIDAVDTPILGVTVALFDATGNIPIPSPYFAGQQWKAITYADGYCFQGLTPGTYVVKVEVPAGYHASAAVPGAGSGGTVVNTTTIRVAATQGTVTYVNDDFLVCTELNPMHLCGHVIDDCTGKGMANITVTLIDSFGMQITTKTDATGYYCFDVATIGEYEIVVTVPMGSKPVGYNTVFVNAQVPGSTYINDFHMDCCRVGNGATRTIGYWATHLAAMQKAVNAGAIDLGMLSLMMGGYQDLRVGVININIVEAIFWGNVSRQGTLKRNPLGQTRMQLAQQLMAAQANALILGTSTGAKGFSGSLIKDARAALDSTNVNLIRSYIGQLDAFNNSGDNVSLNNTQIANAGSATPQSAQMTATTVAGVINPGVAFLSK